MNETNLATHVSDFKQNPSVIKFITSLIEDNFPRKNAPKWVNYDIFFEEIFNDCFDFMVENLCDKNYTYIDHTLAYAYTSEYFDTGTGASHSAADDLCEVVIPHKIVEIYKKCMKN